ncbi:hypothetical protein [Nocardia sp. NPDC004260]
MPDTHSALLDSAIRLLDAGGVEAVTLREVAHGAADLAAAGHLAADGKATPTPPTWSTTSSPT